MKVKLESFDEVKAEEARAKAQEDGQELAIRIEVDPHNPDALGEMQQQAEGAIEWLLCNEAMEFPVHLSALAANGAGHIARYASTGEVTFLAENEEESYGWMLPVHMLLLDHAGYTARIIVTQRLRGN
jgi:hypothetical protein